MSDTPRTDKELSFHELARSDANALASGMTMYARNLERENARLRDALEWFADFRNYEDTVSHEHLPVWSEGIQRAKAALAKEGK